MVAQKLLHELALARDHAASVIVTPLRHRQDLLAQFD